MSNKDITDLAEKIKVNYNTKDPLKLCKILGIEINYTHLNPNFYPAYTIISGKTPVITLNSHFTKTSQMVLCAHELGHALMHNSKILNQFNGQSNEKEEFEANLFAVSLLFDQESLGFAISGLDNYSLKWLLDLNIHKA